jgi:transaldolase/glucose-6-phosphate isomerase
MADCDNQSGLAGGTYPGASSKVSYTLGTFERAVRARLAEWTEANVAGRIWNKDFTVWSAVEVPEISDRLGWLSLPRTMPPKLQEIGAFAAAVRAEQMRDVVLLGMGGSSLAPEVYQATFGNGPGYPRLTVLDSTHPDQVRGVRDRVDPRHTLFIVASKSGTTVEPISLFEYFFHLMQSVDDAGSHFAAITDPGTPLEDLAVERGFRAVFRAFPDIGGRYSALSHFGLVPAALIGVDTAGLLRCASEVAARCGDTLTAETNPGLVLGAILAELALAGRDKITFLTSPSLEAFPQWLEQLIAESTGKKGKGILPVAGEPQTGADAYGADRVFVYLTVAGDADPDSDAFLQTLAADGHPVLRFELDRSLDLAGEMFRWEMAVAAAGAAMGINPFNQPDVQEAKALATKAMAEARKGPGGGDGTIPLADLAEITSAIGDLLASTRPGDYFGILAYVPPAPPTTAALQKIRSFVLDRFHIATTLGFGPRYLHSTGQLHKGGPDSGVFLQIVDEPGTDIEVPNRDFTLGEMISAQALGDYHALSKAGRRVIRTSLGSDRAGGLAALVASVRAVAG